MDVTSFEKMIFAYVIKLRILRWDHPGLSRWALNTMTSVLKRDTHKRDAWRRGLCEDWGRDWSNVATNQGISGATRAGRGKREFSPNVFRESWWHLRFRLLASIAGRESISVVLSHHVCDNCYGNQRRLIYSPSTSPTLLLSHFIPTRLAYIFPYYSLSITFFLSVWTAVTKYHRLSIL